MFRPSLGLFESSWRFREPKRWNAQFWPFTWPWPDTWPFKKIFRSALEPSRRALSNAASPVSLQSLVWELAWGALYAPPPVNGVRLRPRSSAGYMSAVSWPLSRNFKSSFLSVGWSSPRSNWSERGNWTDEAYLIIGARSCVSLLHSRRICFTVNGTLQLSHNGVDCSLKRR